MVKTQVQIPDELYRRAKEIAASREWSFAEIVRRGLEQIVLRHPSGLKRQASWQLPDPVDLGLRADPFMDPEWREGANLTTGTARFMAEQLREQAARYQEGS